MSLKNENWSAIPNALVYDVCAAYRPSPKGGWTVKCQKEDAASAALADVPVADDAEEVDE